MRSDIKGWISVLLIWVPLGKSILKVLLIRLFIFFPFCISSSSKCYNFLCLIPLANKVILIVITNLDVQNALNLKLYVLRAIRIKGQTYIKGINNCIFIL
jgi:hypothetical protein